MKVHFLSECFKILMREGGRLTLVFITVNDLKMTAILWKFQFLAVPTGNKLLQQLSHIAVPLEIRTLLSWIIIIVQNKESLPHRNN